MSSTHQSRRIAATTVSALLLAVPLTTATPGAATAAPAGTTTSVPSHTAAASTAASARTVAVTGRTRTKFKRAVALQRRSGARWVRVRSGRTTAAGAYRFTIARPTTTTRVRVTAPAVRRHGHRYRAWTSAVRVLKPAASPSSGPLAYRVVAATQREYVSAQQSDGMCGTIGGSQTTNADLAKAETGRPQWKQETDVDGSIGVYVGSPVGTTYNSTLTGCSDDFTGNGPQPCEVKRVEHPTGDGTAPMGVIIHIEKGARTAQVWFTPDAPSVGYQGAGNSVCNVEEIKQRQAPGSLRGIEVPVSTLRSTTPFTLKGEGVFNSTTDYLGKPARINQSWQHSVTLQRVDLDGSPVG